ncbi:hypothetical protein ACER0C_000791 [Sarotherodon galilaeus]
MKDAFVAAFGGLFEFGQPSSRRCDVIAYKCSHRRMLPLNLDTACVSITVICGNAEAPPEPTVTLQPSTTQIYSAPPKPTVTLQPSWTQIYSGETVTVRCEIQGGEGAQWTYEWRPAKLNTPPTSSEYRINSTTKSDSGGYSCRGTRSSSWTEWSDITSLKVTGKLDIFYTF